MREFESGATRSDVEGKPDYEGFLSPLVIRRYGQFMLKHQTQEDGKKRDSDNWQKGIPLASYIKSKFRHFVDTWLIHREYETTSTDGDGIEDLLCAELFNTMGYLHTVLIEQLRAKHVGTLDMSTCQASLCQYGTEDLDGPHCLGCHCTDTHPHYKPKEKE